MVERTRREPTQEPVETGRDLRIDTDDLDGCLVEQPDHYYKAALAHAEAVGRRDAAKLALEGLEAQIDGEVRADYDARDEKVTEARIHKEIRDDTRYKDAKRRHLELSTDVDRLLALKEAFQQRSFMLRELVTLTVAEFGDQAGARGAYEARTRRADAGYEARSEEMRARRARRTEDGED